MNSGESLLNGLDSEQLAAVTCPSPTVCVLAGAGSGKTRVLTRRVAWRIAEGGGGGGGSADAAHTLVLTFTRKAADELRARLRGLGIDGNITTGTFHAVAYGQLRRRWLDQGRAVPTVVSHPTRIIDVVLQTMRLARSVHARPVAVEIAWAKSKQLSPHNYEQGIRRYQHRPPLAIHQFVRIFDAYESEKRKRRVIDYDDLLLLMSQALQEDRTFAAAQRWLFRHLYVDEFQDLNGAQFDLLRAWLGDRDDLFVVGDPNQAIYGWNGADASYLLEVERYFPLVETLHLKTNYRSTDQVLAAARAVLPAAMNTSGDEPEIGAVPRVISCPDEHEEAMAITRLVREARRSGRQWNEIAVLVRTNVQRGPIEDAFARFDVPVRLSNGAGWTHHPEVGVALDQLREIPRHKLALSIADFEELTRLAKQDSETQGVYLQQLLVSARECLDNDPQIVNADFLSWIDVASRNDGPSTDANAVTLTTFHRAKGLEWPVVVIAGVEEGLVPHGNVSGAQLDEERRLFYVAITRAKEELMCTWAQQRANARGSVVERKPSPWLSLIQRAVLPDDRPTHQQVREAIHEGRLCLDLADNTHRLRKAMEKWRVARAKLIGTEEHLVMADSVIDAVVERMPMSRAELAEVEGFGPVRAASIGEEILAILASHSTSAS